MDPLLLLGFLLIPYFCLGIVILVKTRALKRIKDYSRSFAVTVYLPTFNEENNITRKLDNLLSQKYPITEILIIDCSSDKTPETIKRYQEKNPLIRLVRQTRRLGMARTLNEAFKLSKGEIFVKTDCDSLSEPDALKELVANFADERVGGATGICIADGGVERYFRKFMTAIQIAESNIDSTLIAHSTSLLAFRKSIVEPVRPNSVADDTEEFLLIRKKGYKTIVDPSVISREEVPTDHIVRRAQKNRRSQGIVKVLMENFDMLLNPRYRKYGTLVLPMEWFILILSPLILIAFGAVLTYVFYTFHPFLAIGFIAVIAGALIQRSNILFAIIDTQLSGLIGFMGAVFKGNNDGLWQKVR